MVDAPKTSVPERAAERQRASDGAGGTRTVFSLSEEETCALGEAFAKGLKGGELILLEGELGLGKTVFARGIASGLELPPEDVSSPSFTLIQEYLGRLTLYHIDAYRLEDARQLEALGFDELCEAGGVIVVEWADRVWPLVADYDPVTIHLEYAPAERERNIRMDNISPEMEKQLKQIGDES